MCTFLTLMNIYYSIKRDSWENSLLRLSSSYIIYGVTGNGQSTDYDLISERNISSLVYNRPKPATPLKTFFLPVRENVTADTVKEVPRIIIGTPNCDIEALGILDEIYLDESFEDVFYRRRRESTIIISSDCLEIQEHCHCTAYNINPFSTGKADLAVILRHDDIILRAISEKGIELAEKSFNAVRSDDRTLASFVESRHHETVEILNRTGKGLPDYRTTGRLVKAAGESVWKRYSSKCVSCGACTTICPTCTCFLLIDKPGFHKVKQMDACQYPGFERVAGGEDSLGKLPSRFRNRYMCKYVWKPAKFHSTACTGCGRCIEACIGKINKNELFRELAK
jgi:ferredoxin